MKKMSSAVVMVLMMVSTSNAFADSTCADIQAKIDASSARIDEEAVQMKIFEEVYIQAETRKIMNANERKDDSFILGSGQERLQALSFQALRSHANSIEKIGHETVNRDALKAQFNEKCSDTNKGE